MNKIIFSFPDDRDLATQIAKKSNIELGETVFRHFPDGDSYVQICSDVKDKDVILVCSLNNPDEKVIPIIFFAETARELGAKSVGLVAPYLAYMRQDKRFQAGEAINSKIFGALLSRYVDRLITIDPHLHRHKTLDEIYSIPTQVLHAANLIAEWIKVNVDNPVLVGPDSESKQWVSHVAKLTGAPFMVLEKHRHGDRDVEISVPNVDKYKTYTPVLVDDIISTARTMIETVKHLRNAKLKPAICIGVHGVFANNSYQDLLDSHVEKVITCNTIKHVSNGIDVDSIIAEAL